MKKIIFVTMFVGLLCAACDTTSSDNGDLDGMWYLTRIDTLSNGHSADYRDRRIFWSFQGTLAQFNHADGTNHYYMSRFDHTASRLRLSDVFLYDRVEGDRFIDSSTLNELRPFGINNLSEDYLVKSLDEDKMILQDEELCLHFEKY
jgi:hypothetical protein